MKSQRCAADGEHKGGTQRGRRSALRGTAPPAANRRPAAQQPASALHGSKLMPGAACLCCYKLVRGRNAASICQVGGGSSPSVGLRSNSRCIAYECVYIVRGARCCMLCPQCQGKDHPSCVPLLEGWMCSLRARRWILRRCITNGVAGWEAAFLRCPVLLCCLSQYFTPPAAAPRPPPLAPGARRRRQQQQRWRLLPAQLRVPLCMPA